MRRIVYIVLLAIFAASCAGDMQRRLGEIESMIDTDSVSAYRALLEIDSSSIKNDADRALYDLLMVEKTVKNYEPVSPSVISRAHRAADYFGDRRLTSRRADAHFYLGRAYQHAKDYPSAIRPALEAIDDATELGDTFRMAKAHDLLGDIYRMSYLVGPELSHKRLANKFHGAHDRNSLYYIW
ncbi:MAG: hypothetical protein Q4C34_08490, partial [Bacteroidales bacterium]|nr:hypothetical protein [Bacteroidales bacterium]